MASYNTLVLTIEANKYYSLDVSNDGKTRKYVLNTAFNIQLAEHTSTKKVTINKTTYELSIQDLSFKKKMYEAGEINVVIQFSKVEGASWVAPDRSVLEKVFKKKKVTLSWGTINDKNKISAGEAICQGYYVHELSPRYMSDSMTLTLKIYSPDKVMTLGKHCKSWVSSQLGKDVFMKQVAEFKKPYLKETPASTVGTYTVDSDATKAAQQAQQAVAETEKERDAIEGDVDNLTHLKVCPDREAIIPYLVQYNESFWDFLVRSTNRWGEFLYYENGKLHVGVNKSSEKTVRAKNSTEEADFKYNSITYCDLNESPVADEDKGEICDGVSYDAHMDRTYLEKSKYAVVKNGIYSSWDDGLNMWGAKTIGKVLCSGKNLFDFVVDMMVDDSIAWGQATKKTKEANDDFDTTYFGDSSSTDAAIKAHFDLGKTIYNQFGTVKTNNNESTDEKMAPYIPFSATVLKYVPDLTPTIYNAVRQCEEKAAQNAVCLDFDTDFANLTLGQVFNIDGGSTKYIVTQVSTKSVVGPVKEPTGQEVIKKHNVYEVYALAETGKSIGKPVFFPAPSPAGHIRFSAPQRAVVCDAKDPSHQGRVRVRYDWQVANKSTGKAPTIDSDGNIKDDTTDVACTPWLVYAQPGGNKGTGSFYQHYIGELVLVDFANGNVERPYVVGALYTSDQTVPASTYTNNIVHVTPGGQAIKMSDGTGAGATAFTAALMPSFKMVQGFYPGVITGGLDTKDTKSFEGSIELSDKFGMYSIKGSTDGRNITISSPFGDVKLNAFTGITISAPNGDVKIQGKNVSIEAGNNLTITSGKNIKDKWYASYMYGENPLANMGLSLGAAVTKKLASMAGGFIDFSVLRHTLEIFVKPIEGKMTVKSNRYLSLEAGKGKTGYPIDTYKQGEKHWKLPKFPNASDQGKLNNTILSDFQKITGVVNAIFTTTANNYGIGREFKNGLVEAINTNTAHAEGGDKLPCNEADAIIDALWANPDANIENTIGFKEMLADNITKDNITGDQANFHIAHVPNLAANLTDQQKKEAGAAKITQERNTIITKVTNIALVIQSLKEITINQGPAYNQLSETGRSALTNNLIDSSALKTIFDNDANKHFTTEADHLFTDNDKKAVRRKFFIALVDAYKFERVKTGVVAKIPEAPDPYAAGIDAKWATYVNSIQAMPKPSDYNAKSFFNDNLLDPLLNQISIPGMICNFHDNLAFGSEKNGQILFSSGADTMVLDKEIMRANTDGAEEDIDKAKDIRILMNA